MSISSVMSNWNSQIQNPGSGRAPARRTDADGAQPPGDAPPGRGDHGMGGMGRAVFQALSQMGLLAQAPSPGATSPGGASSPASAPGTDASATTATSAPDTLRRDVHDVMHALFDAVREQVPHAGPGPGAPPRGEELANALATLATQAAKGQVAPRLQQAFTQLMDDLRPPSATPGSGTASAPAPEGGSAGTPAPTTASGATANENTQLPSPTLEQFLRALMAKLTTVSPQDDGARFEPTGNLLEAQA